MFIALETLLTLNAFIASETLHPLLRTALTAAVMFSKLTFFRLTPILLRSITKALEKPEY